MHPTPPSTTRTIPWFLVPALLACLSACADDAPERDAGRDADGSAGQSELPAPEGAVGSVTGMPANPGPGAVPIAPVATPQGDAGGAASPTADPDGGPGGTGGVQVGGDAGRAPIHAPTASVDGAGTSGGVPPSVDAPAPAAPTVVVEPPPGQPPVTASTTFVIDPAATGEAHPEGHDDH